MPIVEKSIDSVMDYAYRLEVYRQCRFSPKPANASTIAHECGLFSYGLYTYGLGSYGLYSDVLYSYGLCSPRLREHLPPRMAISFYTRVCTCLRACLHLTQAPTLTSVHSSRHISGHRCMLGAQIVAA